MMKKTTTPSPKRDSVGRLHSSVERSCAAVLVPRSLIGQIHEIHEVHVRWHDDDSSSMECWCGNSIVLVQRSETADKVVENVSNGLLEAVMTNPVFQVEGFSEDHPEVEEDFGPWMKVKRQTIRHKSGGAGVVVADPFVLPLEKAKDSVLIKDQFVGPVSYLGKEPFNKPIEKESNNKPISGAEGGLKLVGLSKSHFKKSLGIVTKGLADGSKHKGHSKAFFIAQVSSGKGPRFTWARNNVLVSLDRALVNVAWIHNFPESSVVHLHRLKSDHHPILLRTVNQVLSFNNKPFRFLSAWLTHASYDRVNGKNWLAGSGFPSASDSLSSTLKKWNINVFENIFKRKKRLIDELKGAEITVSNYPSSTNIDVENLIRSKIELVLWQEESLWIQKARTKWIVEGDRNTHYFHLTAFKKRSLIGCGY
ncbi:hypothetical protein LINPERHAP2_LOCUS39809 [Linum perenne]